MSAPDEAVRAANDALIAHAVEHHMHAICHHQARIAADAAAPAIEASARAAIVEQLDAWATEAAAKGNDEKRRAFVLASTMLETPPTEMHL